MALAIDGSTPAKITGTATAITSGSFSPPANSALWAYVDRNVPGANGNADGTVTSTGGLTWTLIGRKSVNASSTGGAGTAGCVEIWRAYATSAPGAITVTDTRADANSGTGYNHILKVEVITGEETAWGGAIAAASSTSGLPSVALTTTRANSWVFATSSDWSAGGLGTVGSGQTLIDEDHQTGQYSAHVWRRTATTPTSGTSVTSNLTAPSGQQYNILAVEIREPAGGGASIAPDGISVPVALGSPTLTDGSMSVAPDGISVPVALGAPSLSWSASIAPDGVAVPVALGSPDLTWSGSIAPDGITIPVALGAPAVGASSVAPDGIAIPVTLGDPTLSWSGSVAPGGITVPVALGAPIVGAVGVAPDGISIPVVLGDPALSWSGTAAPDGIGIPVSLGSPTLTLAGIAPDGISVPVVLGSPTLVWSGAVSPDGISVPVSLGAPSVNMPGTRIIRPNTGTTSRPSTGTITRPNTGIVSRP